MSRSIAPEGVARYVAALVHETHAQTSLREETAKMTQARMQLGIDAMAALAWLAKLVGARRTIEVGTFTGYSALAVAQVLPAGGKLVACDVSEEWTSIARRHWAGAGVADKIDLRIAPATQTLDALIAAGETDGYDLAFIDADKPAYDAYYERCLRLVRPGGVIVFDNMLWSGAVAAPGPKDADTAALDALNKKVMADPRVDACLLTVGDGLLVARRH